MRQCESFTKNNAHTCKQLQCGTNRYINNLVLSVDPKTKKVSLILYNQPLASINISHDDIRLSKSNICHEFFSI